jgi:hypothetical protein
MNKKYLAFATEAEKQALQYNHPCIIGFQKEIRRIIKFRSKGKMFSRSDAQVSEACCREIQRKTESIEKAAPVEEKTVNFTDEELHSEIERLTGGVP